jgi:pimeloyl-ACP methyl ester carboxylesterase
MYIVKFMKAGIIVPWFNYWKTKNSEEFSFLVNKLKKEGFKAYLFNYEERPDDLNDLLRRLHKFILSLKETDISLIGFSLGSYLSVKYSQKYKNNKIKKLVLCFPLVMGSKFFRTIYRIFPFWKNSSGNVLYKASYEKLDYSRIPKKIQVGIIRGKKRINRRLVSILAQFFLLFKKNDGLFLVSECDFGNYKKITLPIGHYEGPGNTIVADSIIKFLKKL